jgi:hypothetical protein
MVWKESYYVSNIEKPEDLLMITRKVPTETALSVLPPQCALWKEYFKPSMLLWPGVGKPIG